MKTFFVLISLSTVFALAGCSKNPADIGTGSSSISGGTGGEGSGPTGTGGGEPADNPAPESKGTGTD